MNVAARKTHFTNTLQFLIDADIPERTISWRQYVTTVKNVATGLRQAGLQDQDCVGVLSDNDIYYHVLGDAIVAAGGIFCAMQTSEKPAELRHQIKAASIKWLFASPRLLNAGVEAARDAGLPEANISVYDPPGLESYTGPYASMSRLLLADGKAWQNPNTGKDLHSIMAHRWFSSGTTVRLINPKSNWSASTAAVSISYQARCNQSVHTDTNLSRDYPKQPTSPMPRTSSE